VAYAEITASFCLDRSLAAVLAVTLHLPLAVIAVATRTNKNVPFLHYLL
jgi:hypothetical protein